MRNSVFQPFLLQRDVPQMSVLLMEVCAMIQVSILQQPHRTVVANFVSGNFGLFPRNPWQPPLAEPRLKNTEYWRNKYHSRLDMNKPCGNAI